MSRGALIRVKIGEGRYVKMYEQDAREKGLLDKQRSSSENKERGKAEIKSSAHVIPAYFDFTIIKGISDTASRKLNDANIHSIEDLMISDISMLTDKQQQSIIDHFQGQK